MPSCSVIDKFLLKKYFRLASGELFSWFAQHLLLYANVAVVNSDHNDGFIFVQLRTLCDIKFVHWHDLNTGGGYSECTLEPADSRLLADSCRPITGIVQWLSLILGNSALIHSLKSPEKPLFVLVLTLKGKATADSNKSIWECSVVYLVTSELGFRFKGTETQVHSYL